MHGPGRLQLKTQFAWTESPNKAASLRETFIAYLTLILTASGTTGADKLHRMGRDYQVLPIRHIFHADNNDNYSGLMMLSEEMTFFLSTK